MPPQFLVVFSLTPPQMGLSCCLTMATIVPKTIRGHRYYYLVQTAWVNGRSRYVKQLYLGKAEDIGKLFEEATAPVPTQGLPFEFGVTAALYSVAQQLQLAEIIDRHVPKRNQGLSVGQYALLAILNRCLAPTSKTQLAHWYAGTVLYRLLPADPAQLRSQRFFDHMGELSLEAIQAIEKEIAQVLMRDWGIDSTSLIYDATNFFSYIDTRTPSRLARRGKNKARRIDLRQVSLGLLASRDYHVPLFHETYPGNRPDAVEFREVLRSCASATPRSFRNLITSLWFLTRGTTARRTFAYWRTALTTLLALWSPHNMKICSISRAVPLTPCKTTAWQESGLFAVRGRRTGPSELWWSLGTELFIKPKSADCWPL